VIETSSFAALVGTFAPKGEVPNGMAEIDIQSIVASFQTEMTPLEVGDELKILTDNRTGARYCECHVFADKLVALSTIDAPLDPAQPEYRMNRDLLVSRPAFIQMIEDAKQRRSFSNLVAEYRPTDTPSRPLAILGGQHRYEAIRLACENKINEVHGVKVYFGLDTTQRKDVAEIANRNIAISGALLDRFAETHTGSAMRDWCQKVGLLAAGQDFGAQLARGRITVHLVRTFIHNFYLGKKVIGEKFKETETTPFLYRAGKDQDEWEKVLDENPSLYEDEKLLEAGRQFVRLDAAQRAWFAGKTGVPRDFPYKATNAAVLAAWAFVAGMFQTRPEKLKRHYGLADIVGRDPLNAADSAKGRHTTDPPNYRGLGYRVDARERAQMVELFNIIADKGDKITTGNIRAAIYAWFAKKAELESQRVAGATP
jgi:hypothetical protein